MTARRVLRLLARVLTLIVVGVSGTYLLVYLYRWEWNRAMMAGLFFVAGEIALVATSILNRIDRLALRLTGAQREAAEGVYRRLRAVPTEPRDTFRWLRSDTEGLPVFVPVLLGAGVILSALAHVVQRIAISSIDPVVDRAAALQLASLTLPDGGLVPPPDGDRRPGDRWFEEAPHAPATGRWEKLTWTAAGLVGALLLWAAIDVIGDATQARPDADLTGFATVIELRIDDADGVAGSGDADALVVACRPRLPATSRVTEVRAAGTEGVFVVVIEPALGDTGSRRFRGCLEDATLDLIEADLIRMDRVPLARP